MTNLIKKVQELESMYYLGVLSIELYKQAIDDLIQSERTAEALEYLIRKKDIEI